VRTATSETELLVNGGKSVASTEPPHTLTHARTHLVEPQERGTAVDGRGHVAQDGAGRPHALATPAAAVVATGAPHARSSAGKGRRKGEHTLVAVLARATQEVEKEVPHEPVVRRVRHLLPPAIRDATRTGETHARGKR